MRIAAAAAAAAAAASQYRSSRDWHTKRVIESTNIGGAERSVGATYQTQDACDSSNSQSNQAMAQFNRRLCIIPVASDSDARMRCAVRYGTNACIFSYIYGSIKSNG
jgi:hypothetical protein